ncbi:MAG: HAD family hydrolase [Phreatobacter sp.]
MKIDRPDLFDRLPDAVFFDLDDTLYEYPVAHEAAMAAVDDKVRGLLKISSRQLHDAYARARDEVKKRLGATASGHSRLLYIQRMLESLGLRNQVLLFLDLEQTYWRTFLSRCSLHPHVDEVLTTLHSRNVKIVIVTDLTAQIQFRKIAHLRLDRYVDSVVTSEEAGCDKIGLKPFELAIEKLALDRQARIWVIGDDVGDMAAANLGRPVALIQKVNPAGRHLQCDASFTTFDQLLELVARL